MSPLSSAAIGMLVATQAATQVRDGKLALVNVGEGLLQLFRISKIERRFAIHATLEAAVRSLAS